jgi:hypothetical protein
VGEGVLVAVLLLVREALVLAPGMYWPRMNKSSTRKVLILHV